jgi:hypothetical protein
MRSGLQGVHEALLPVKYFVRSLARHRKMGEANPPGHLPEKFSAVRISFGKSPGRASSAGKIRD